MKYKLLLGICSVLWLALAGPTLAEVRSFEMTIEEVEIEVAPGFKSKVWGFNGQVPGPLYHVNEGDEVEVTVHNFSTLNHTVHWHGIFQTGSWQHDGVPHVTRHPIEPGESHTYRFIADKPGSLWYHCHVNVSEHVGLRGMWGPLVVAPAAPTELEKAVTKDAILMFSGWNSQVADNYGEGGHPGQVINYFSINGKEHGGSMLVVEYEEIEKPEFYEWRNIEYEPDFYMIESMAAPKGQHSSEHFRGQDLLEF